MKQFLHLEISASGKAEFFYGGAENANRVLANKGRVNKIRKTERKAVILMTLIAY
jgi:hypothetical protein